MSHKRLVLILENGIWVRQQRNSNSLLELRRLVRLLRGRYGTYPTCTYLARHTYTYKNWCWNGWGKGGCSGLLVWFWVQVRR